jgi:hypothetical protein
MITRRTQCIYNFGVCVAFVVSGFLSTYAIETLLPNIGKTVILPVLDQSTRRQLEDEKELEPLRDKALFYFELSLELKQAHTTAELRMLEGVRHVSFILAGLFAVAGLMAVAARSGASTGAPGGLAGRQL